MKYFLVEYNRQTEDVSLTTYEEGERDQAALATREREMSKAPYMEVVLLGADSEETIRLTHSRYFSRMRERARSRAGKVAQVAEDARPYSSSSRVDTAPAPP